MSGWRYNRDWHVGSSCAQCVDFQGVRDVCDSSHPCYCCVTARADEAEAANARYLGTLLQHIGIVDRLSADLDAAEATIARVRENAELRLGVPAVHGTYQSGYMAAMRDVLQALDGGAG